MHHIFHEFDVWPDLITDNSFSCPWAFKKSPIDLECGVVFSLFPGFFFVFFCFFARIFSYNQTADIKVTWPKPRPGQLLFT